MKSKEFIEGLVRLADEYIEECLGNTKTHVAGSGKVVEVKDRHIPTIDYFLRIWLPIVRKEESINPKTWYEWLNENEAKSNTIKGIKNKFHALSKDIVANEGKGIFYAKNALGMHDKQHIENKTVDKFDFDGNDDKGI